MDIIKKEINKALRVSYLLASSLVGDLNKEDKAELDLWLNKEVENTKLHNEILDQNAFEQRAQQIERIDMPKEWDRFQAQIKPATIFLQSRLTRVLKYVAAIVLPVSIALLVLLNQESDKAQLADLPVEIAPGVKRALLVLSTGEQFELSDSTLNISHKQEGIEIWNEDGQLNYSSADGSLTQTIRYNTLIVGRGEEYQLALADGTKVWLNSDSKLKYPVNFIKGQNREVELVYGEAYFDVSKSTNRNGGIFCVKTRNQEIEVLSTEFNIQAYQKDNDIVTTLVEGKVKISNGIESKFLTPSEQSLFNIKKQDITIQKVDKLFDVIAWKEGYFSFRQKSMKDIMKVLSRWYDIEYSFKDIEKENKTFTGVLDRESSIDLILSHIQKTNEINYQIHNKIVIIE